MSLDLNLLVTLDVLLRERNVTRAAERIGLSQPAVSASLARLRRHFDDDLLSRVGNRYQLTPLARRLSDLTPYALEGVERVFSAAADFDPSAMRRQFSVVTSDYALATLGPEILRVAAAEAPGVRFRFQSTSPYLVDHAAEALRTVDGIVLPHGFLSDFPHLELHVDDWVCLVSQDNARVGDELTVADLSTLPWVVLYDLPTAFAPSARQLRMAGHELAVDVAVDSFLAMPFLVAGSERVALVQRRIATRLADATGLRVLELPVDPIPLVEAFWWHPVYEADPGHHWLRSTLAAAARKLLDTGVAIDAVDMAGPAHLLDR